MVGVILCSKARFFSAARTLSMSDSNRSAARVSCTLKQVSSTSEEVMPWWTKRASGPTISARWVVKAMTSCLVSRSISSIRAMSKVDVARLGPDRLRGFLGDDAEFRLRISRMRLDLEPDLEAGLGLPDGGHFRAGIAGDHRKLRTSRAGTRGDPGRFVFTLRFSKSCRGRPPIRRRRDGKTGLLRQGRNPLGTGRPPPLKAGQPALHGQADKLRVRSHAGLGLDQIMVVLHGLDAEIEV